MFAVISALLSGVTTSGGGLTASSPGSSALLSPTTSSSSITQVGGALTVAAIVVEVLAVLAVMAVVGLFVIIVVANRADPDPSGRRPQSVYYFAVSFVTLVTTIAGSIVVVTSLVRLIGGHTSGIGNATARAVVLGALLTVVSGFLLRTHLRRGVTLAGSEETTPSRRVGQSYVSAVSFLAVLVLLVVTIFSVYLVFALAGPGVFGSFGGRTASFRYLIDAVYIALVAGLVLYTHRRLVPPGLPFLGRPGPA